MSDAVPSSSGRIRSGAEETWNAALSHRFFREIATDAIDDRDFARYLRIEYGFVDTAAVALGYAVVKAPSFKERRRLGLGLYGLVTDQEKFFVDAFERMAVPAEARTGLAAQGLSQPLHNLFLTVAENEGYEEILTCVLTSEWMYLTWCSKADRTPSSRPYIRGWVALHAGGAFAEHVAWVRSQIDARAPLLSEARQAQLMVVFEQTLAAEVKFHDAVYAVE